MTDPDDRARAAFDVACEASLALDAAVAALDETLTTLAELNAAVDAATRAAVDASMAVAAAETAASDTYMAWFDANGAVHDAVRTSP